MSDDLKVKGYASLGVPFIFSKDGQVYHQVVGVNDSVPVNGLGGIEGRLGVSLDFGLVDIRVGVNGGYQYKYGTKSVRTSFTSNATTLLTGSIHEGRLGFHAAALFRLAEGLRLGPELMFEFIRPGSQDGIKPGANAIGGWDPSNVNWADSWGISALAVIEYMFVKGDKARMGVFGGIGVEHQKFNQHVSTGNSGSRYEVNGDSTGGKAVLGLTVKFGGSN